MVSLDQVELLEAKIESAVEKITQLQAENDALRNRVQELSNALSAKSEQLSLCEKKVSERELELFNREKEQSLIESGILKALNRLNSIENSVLKSGSNETVASVPVTEAAAPSIEPTNPINTIQEEPAAEEPVFEETVTEEPVPEESEEPDFANDYSDEAAAEPPVEYSEIDIPVEPPVNEDSGVQNFGSSAPVENPFDINKSDVPGFDIF